jgi:hypothetical protein
MRNPGRVIWDYPKESENPSPYSYVPSFDDDPQTTTSSLKLKQTSSAVILKFPPERIVRRVAAPRRRAKR